jgi:hypothetical protein
MSDLLKRMKHWLQYPRLSSGEKLMQEAVQQIERLHEAAKPELQQDRVSPPDPDIVHRS